MPKWPSTPCAKPTWPTPSCTSKTAWKRWTTCCAAARFADREEGEPAVLLLDIKMPRMDGLEVLQKLRDDDELKRLPVVILSSSREESDLARSWDMGVNAYVVKPVDADQFFDAVKTLGRFWAVFNEVPSED